MYIRTYSRMAKPKAKTSSFWGLPEVDCPLMTSKEGEGVTQKMNLSINGIYLGIKT